ncbi:MAG: FlgD immunoglobulin-like domain containing protein [Candidatus Krumholzibacteria bacterium]|nr:FlgD immunoglobulin-like domain containing protein [Candidatus Krumholzibacteria bacterium]
MKTKTWIAPLTALLIAVFVSPAVSQETTDYLIEWVPNPEPTVAGYIIYRSLYAETGFQVIDSVGVSTTSYLDTDLQKGTFYYYRLRAKDAEGNRGLFSNLVGGMTIPQTADAGTNSLCRITDMQESGGNSLNISWSTQVPTIGFVQYDRDALLDSMTTWDDDTYATTHGNTASALLSPSTYYLRAISYDQNDIMIVSAIDTFEFTGESPSPLSAPQIGIFPVPYQPAMGGLSLVNLPEDGQVAIYNRNGIEVWSENVGPATEMSWDGVNKNGTMVASGVYYVITKDAGGSIVNKRPIMIVN